MTSNEAAERLRKGINSLPTVEPRMRRSFIERWIDEALAAERRATVERIRNLLMADVLLTSNRLVSERIRERLDKEAAR